MRIRSSAASIAAVTLTALLLAGCTAPDPGRSPAPAETAAIPEPTSVEQPVLAPDLRELCEQLLPTSAVQDVFGESVVPSAENADAAPRISEWAALAGGEAQCRWSAPAPLTGMPAVEIIVVGDGAEAQRMSRQHVEAAEDLDIRLDALGDSVDACRADRCEYSVLTDEGYRAWFALQGDAGSTLPVEETRAHWDPVLADVLESLPVVMEPLVRHSLQSPSCASLLSVEEARSLAGDPQIEALDEASVLQGERFNPTLLAVPRYGFHGIELCDWTKPALGDGISVRYSTVPETFRESALAQAVERVDGETIGARIGEPVTVAGADGAWRFCYFENPEPTGCGIDVAVGDTWMQVRSHDDDLVLPAAERIIANLGMSRS